MRALDSVVSKLKAEELNKLCPKANIIVSN
jgi:hypothetical protein